MDVILDVLDTFVFDRVYASVLPIGNTTLEYAFQPPLNQHVGRYYPLQPSEWATASSWKRDYLPRQAASLFFLMWFFGVAMYLFGSTLLYHTIFDKSLLQHPRILKNQIALEIKQGLLAMPIMSILTVPFFLTEIRGWSKLYDFASEAPFPAYNYLQYPLFIAFTDSGIYWIHRWLHHPLVYRWLHKKHHKWVVPTPFASYAFNPVDGWSQSLPYHLFPMLFPLQKSAYIGLFVFVTMWTVVIHDAECLSRSAVVNGPECHTLHHLYFNYNYGQFTTLWDRLGGTYRKAKGDELKAVKTH
ncbi:copper-transporting ATPase [Aspergillus heteromorphus CBS 117.55]|uniref:Copper-transporting ATPase n=1 Tax=Aspergillus heteromorphus CBS 117.55 TaxID=1448321 RepID=A0A317X4U8_9EURO|nr:copper-transporting ATPase [Aspergillus heteromorphus CBS 117.55]PWY92632.1 copper-transporting ATPase [Aspergillus heteromorphus CBS 117.55]